MKLDAKSKLCFVPSGKASWLIRSSLHWIWVWKVLYLECKKVRYRRVIIYFSLPPLNVGFSKMKCCEFLARTNQTLSFFDNRSMKLEFIYTSNTIQLHEQFFPTYFLDILMMECHMYVWHGVFCFLIFKHSIFRRKKCFYSFW